MNLSKKLPRWIKYTGAEWVGKLFGRRFFWDIEALLKAKDAILSGCESEEEFFEQGRKDIEYLDSLGLVNSDTVSLHIGCGIGRVEKFLVPKVKEAYGIDVSKIMIKKARKLVHFPNAYFYHTNGKDLKIFKNNMFTLIYSFFVFQHFSRSIAYGYISEIQRTLKQGGKFLCQFQYKLENENITDPTEEHPWGIRLYNEHDINALGANASLQIKEIFNLKEAQLLRTENVEHGKCNVWALFQKE